MPCPDFAIPCHKINRINRFYPQKGKKRPNNPTVSPVPNLTFSCPDAAFCKTIRMILWTQIKGNDLISKKTSGIMKDQSGYQEHDEIQQGGKDHDNQN
jgi:hypothetical protein